ncbi:NlpC/P60 family protein [Pantoea sp. ME81]|uniref:NlpC/P60 family protein n=1 Tax=Pantoea sp. ME81 TaxID=2743935 RepID=UPI0015F6190A|nr:NlpC/P60 family protein [Pantoea sp. ME81]
MATEEQSEVNRSQNSPKHSTEKDIPKKAKTTLASRWRRWRSAKKSCPPDIYKILHKRSRNTRFVSTALIIILIVAATFISNMIVSWKDNQSSWISQIYEAYNNPKGLRPGDLVFFKEGVDGKRSVGIYIGNDMKSGDRIIEKPKASIDMPPEGQEFVQPKFTLPNIEDVMKGRFGFKPEKTESEKVADSIATVLISLSLVIFVGFVMRAVLVFTRYYMQLATDYDNQKIAFLLSKHEAKDFGSTLEELRNNKINFEKTPTMPQEKIILGLVDALKSNLPNTKDKPEKE